MKATRLDGKREAQRLLRTLKRRLARRSRYPTLATILVGQRYDSAVYVRLKVAAAKKVGIQTIQCRLPENTSQRRLERLIDQLNTRRPVTGILLQLPLPSQLNADRAIRTINPRKDVDGFHPDNQAVTPPPVAAVLHFLALVKPKRQARVVILGKKSVFTEQLRSLFIKRGWRVSLVKARWATYTKKADIIVTVLGRGPRLLARQIKGGSIVIDVGIRHQRGKIIGDVDPDVWSKAKAVTPVPGGVGPLTVAYVLMNTCQLAKRRL